MFATIVIVPQDASHKVALICCSSCGCVVGALDGRNVPAMLDTLARKLNVTLE